MRLHIADAEVVHTGFYRPNLHLGVVEALPVIGNDVLAVRHGAMTPISLPNHFKGSPVEKSDAVIGHHEHAMISFLDLSGVRKMARGFIAQQDITGLKVEHGEASCALRKNDAFTVHENIAAKRDSCIGVAVERPARDKNSTARSATVSRAPPGERREV